MKYDLLSSIGLGNIDISYFFIGLFVLLIILIILIIIQIVNTNKLKKKYHKFMIGKNAKSLEREIMNLVDDNRIMKESINSNKEDISNIYKKLEKAIQKIGIVKYDAFKQLGGELSYSIALLDENNDGIIINSVYGVDGCYSYIKTINKGISDLPLGNEEQKALDQAVNNKRS